ncbi:DUF4148 domain-containing protein [Ottowia thiooxydans]|uniref:DUF4148 domain-containing protein n=1 Tax=Ottowia thiooxydans TaxID=219182 RepID=UPI0004225437|nr:DUF4148 domain-containing protein [Ottowia thiooxydans]
MNKRQSLSISALAILAGLFAAPNLAQADTAWHASNGDVVRFTPEHIGSNTRQQVVAELDAARANGTLKYIQMSVPVPVNAAAPTKTRQQVIDEMRDQSAEQRRSLNELYQN